MGKKMPSRTTAADFKMDAGNTGKIPQAAKQPCMPHERTQNPQQRMEGQKMSVAS
jgi:hypothetical protein